MLLRINRHQKAQVQSAAPAWRSRKSVGLRALACAIVLVTLPATYNLHSQTPSNPNKSILLPAVNRPPDANAQMAMREQQNKKQSFDAANLERKRQINDDSAHLLKEAGQIVFIG